MKAKNTLFLILVATGLFAFIWFYETGLVGSKEAAKADPMVVQFDRNTIKTITIKNGATTIELHKEGGWWQMDKPVKDRANPAAVSQLFTTAENLKSEGLASDKKGATKDELRDFGLANPETRVIFTGGKKPVEILLGKDGAVEGRLYARLGDSEVAHVIGTDLKTQITKKPDEFRDPKLTDIFSTEVNKLSLKTAAGEIELAKTDNQWSLAKPLKARGDGQKVGDLLAQVTNAQVSTFMPDPANLTAYGLQEPRGTVTLHADGREQPIVLQIGGPSEQEKDKIYVKLSTRDAVCVVPKALATLLDTKPNDLRDRQLVRVDQDIVDRMTIESPGKEKIVLARSGESWVRKVGGKDVPTNPAAAVRLLSDISRQQVAAFVADVATELPKYGLDQPAVKVTLSSYASENTAESNSGERPIVTVLFGKVEGDTVYAKLDDEPFVVSLPRIALESAMTDPLQWQDIAIFRNQPEDLTSVEIARMGQPTLTIERDKEGKWALAKGDGKVNQINADSLANTLAKLRAVRWIGPVAPEYALAKPNLTVTFKVKDQAGKLEVGSVNRDGLYYATADGLPGVFVINGPDYTVFGLPLIDKPASAAPPVAPAIDMPGVAVPPATPSMPTPTPPSPAMPN